MLRNYFLLATRHLLKSKLFSFINILGLAIGMAACFLIVQYVAYERSFDRFHDDPGSVYRVTNTIKQASGNVISMATNHPGAGPGLKQSFPEVADYSRIVHQSIFLGDVSAWSVVGPDGKMTVFNEENVYDADPSFLTMFNFPMVDGDRATALEDKSSIVISETVARKFFGTPGAAVGKVLRMNGQRSFTIAGVVQVPQNSHVHFDILTSFFLREGWGGGWDTEWSWKWPEFYTYVRLQKNADPNALQAKFPDFITRTYGERLKQLGNSDVWAIQPIVDVHLNAGNLQKEREVHGSGQMIAFLSLVAALILVVAWINYVNLSTCKSVERAREVGVRKVAGATRYQLVFQFLTEAFIVNGMAVVLAVLMIIGTLPFFVQLTGKNIGTSLLELEILRDPVFWYVTTAILILGSLTAGLYPAFVLSSFRIVSVLKGKFLGSGSGIVLRKALVGVQFAISVMLIAGTLVVYRQVTFMRHQDLGYDDQLFMVKAPVVADSLYTTRWLAFRSEAERIARIKSLTPTTEIPGKFISQVNYIARQDASPEGNIEAAHVYTDHTFSKTFGVDIVAGENFNEMDYIRYERDRTVATRIMLNEAAVHRLGFKNADEAIGRLIKFGLGPRDWPGEIIGVFKDYHQRSLREGYSPIIYFPMKDYAGQYVAFNMSMESASETIGNIEGLFHKHFPGNEFNYFFLDDYFDQQYSSDQKFGKIFGIFSGLALLVAALGQLGLSTFMISQRTREVAIRKVLGASVTGMIRLFSRDFVVLVIVSSVVTLPELYIFANQWLDTFAFRVEIGWLLFIVPGLILLLISLATVGLQTLRTGLQNPVKVLRSE